MKKLSVINAKIIRLNLKAEHTKIFSELDEIGKDIVNKNIDYVNNEESVFCFFSTSIYWWVITNFRIIISENNIITYIYLDEIQNVHLNDIFENEIMKEECDSIDIKFKDGSEKKLNVEKKTWYAVHNLLKFLISG